MDDPLSDFFKNFRTPLNKVKSDRYIFQSFIEDQNAKI